MVADLGVDPGAWGSMILRVDSEPVACVSWRPRQRRSRPVVDVRTWPNQGYSDLVRTRHEVGKVAARYLCTVGAPWRLICEDAVVWRNPSTAIKIARSAGILIGPVEDFATAPAVWVKRSVWAKRILGLSPWARRATVKSAARDYLSPEDAEIVRRIVEDLSLSDKAIEDVCDAMCISRLGSLGT